MATKTASSTSSANHTSHPAFVPSQSFATQTQRVLVDLTELSLQGKQLHWNVVGKNFRDMHLVLDEVVDAARAFTDEVAERMRALYIVPDGRTATVSEDTTLAPLPSTEVDTATCVDLVVAALYATSKTARDIHDDIDAEDPTTADLLHSIIDRLEQLAWMIDAENRVANQSKPAQLTV
ncbi:starvation-inducible DNA-binding protein [Nocardioides albertanoniae]|uniref:Starvation-inducible DNA-binding protein n=1 Tax=Nocardioides albertanoniae TaxID=1175486 RepID=A0A543A113_9ACTN|nr:DNA starvation/stationary phase protection protein [Nocardioides albertanoniae]TQL66271.1 starvation-inducible DNA-binding protein [Nocardioides albertanoniae]